VHTYHPYYYLITKSIIFQDFIEFAPASECRAQHCFIDGGGWFTSWPISLDWWRCLPKNLQQVHSHLRRTNKRFFTHKPLSSHSVYRHFFQLKRNWKANWKEEIRLYESIYNLFKLWKGCSLYLNAFNKNANRSIGYPTWKYFRVYMLVRPRNLRYEFTESQNRDDKNKASN
jgi:hypothetical protein